LIIFNITAKVEHGIHNDFISWIDEDVLKKPLEEIEQPSRFFRLLGVDTSDGVTYCLQHYFKDQPGLNRYRVHGEVSFREELADRYGDKLVIFTSVLSEV